MTLPTLENSAKYSREDIFKIDDHEFVVVASIIDMASTGTTVPLARFKLDNGLDSDENVSTLSSALFKTDNIGNVLSSDDAYMTSYYRQENFNRFIRAVMKHAQPMLITPVVYESKASSAPALTTVNKAPANVAILGAGATGEYEFGTAFDTAEGTVYSFVVGIQKKGLLDDEDGALGKLKKSLEDFNFFPTVNNASQTTIVNAAYDGTIVDNTFYDGLYVESFKLPAFSDDTNRLMVVRSFDELPLYMQFSYTDR